jgi:hypothetical protein
MPGSPEDLSRLHSMTADASFWVTAKQADEEVWKGKVRTIELFLFFIFLSYTFFSSFDLRAPTSDLCPSAVPLRWKYFGKYDFLSVTKLILVRTYPVRTIRSELSAILS